MRPSIGTLFAVLVAMPSAVFAQRPLVTDDADMLQAGNCHIESYVKRQRRINETETWFLPACNAFGSLEMTVGGYRISPSPNSTTGVFLQGKTVFRKRPRTIGVPP